MTSEQLNRKRFFHRASMRQRVTALAVFLSAAGIFTFLNLSATGIIDIDRLFDPCGFVQQYDLPCPTCGVTTAGLSFSTGRVFQAFYIQPAGTLLYLVLAVSGILALPVAVFGVYSYLLERFFSRVKIRHIIVVSIIAVVLSWMLMLSRTL